MRGLAGFLLLLAGLLPACATVVSQPTLERELAVALERRRVDGIADRVLAFRGGLLREAADGDRVDRPARAAAAARAAASLRAELADVHRLRLDREGRVDLDLCSFLLDEAMERVRLADLDEDRLRALSGDAAAAAFLADPGAPSADLVARLAAGAPSWFPPGAPLPAGAAEASADDLRTAARRARQVAGLLRRRGDEAQVLRPADGGPVREAARAAADRSEAAAGALDEEAKKRPESFEAPAGRTAFVAALRTRHGVDAAPEELERVGAELLASITAELEALAAERFPGRTWKEALAEVRKDHPAPSEVPAEAMAAAVEAREFCIERGLVTIPAEARLGHPEIVGDGMARSYPFAAFGFREETAEGSSGRYLVSPGATWMDDAQREERLGGACRPWTRVVAPHEMWPGHHLQFWYADRRASRLRREAGTSVFVEGWGLYCEWLLDRHGFFPRPEERLCLLSMRAWRACRVILDARLHCGGCTPEEGIDFLVDRAGLTRDAATAEVRRYMGSPTQPFSYAWGWREILRLRADEEARLGERFSEREFHDRLLSCGPVPFRFVRRLFGYGGEDRHTEPDPDWRRDGGGTLPPGPR